MEKNCLDKVLMYILCHEETFSTYVSTSEANIIYCINTSFAWRELSDIQYIIVVTVLVWNFHNLLPNYKVFCSTAFIFRQSKYYIKFDAYEILQQSMY